MEDWTIAALTRFDFHVDLRPILTNTVWHIDRRLVRDEIPARPLEQAPFALGRLDPLFKPLG